MSTFYYTFLLMFQEQLNCVEMHPDSQIVPIFVALQHL